MKTKEPSQSLGKSPPGISNKTMRMPLTGRPGVLPTLHFVSETSKRLEESLRTKKSCNPASLGLAQPEGGSGIS